MYLYPNFTNSKQRWLKIAHETWDIMVCFAKLEPGSKITQPLNHHLSEPFCKYHEHRRTWSLSGDDVLAGELGVAVGAALGVLVGAEHVDVLLLERLRLGHHVARQLRLRARGHPDLKDI